MKTQRSLTLYKEAFLRLIYPEHCSNCRALLGLSEKILCPQCTEKVGRLELKTGLAASSETFENLDDVWSLFEYKEIVKDLLTAVKFSGRRRILDVFRKRLTLFGELVTQDCFYDAILPIPLSRERLMSRQFNQSEILARFLCEKTRVGLRTDLLKRCHERPSQSSLDKSERLANSYKMFYVSRLSSVKNRNFLLVDDILTTGATTEDAARALKERGAKRADLVTLAYTKASGS